MLRVTSIVGHASSPEIAEQLHRLRHEGRVEHVVIGAADLARRRLRVTTDKGTECAIALPRTQRIEHGSVLELSEARAVVVELEELPWLVLEAADSAAALRLGFLAGHHHWRVRFSGSRLRVALDDAKERYLERLEESLPAGSYSVREE